MIEGLGERTGKEGSGEGRRGGAGAGCLPAHSRCCSSSHGAVNVSGVLQW